MRASKLFDSNISNPFGNKLFKTENIRTDEEKENYQSSKVDTSHDMLVINYDDISAGANNFEFNLEAGDWSAKRPISNQ